MQKDFMARSDHVNAELLNGSVLTITEAKRFTDQLKSVLEGIPNVYGNGYVGLLKAIGDPLLAQKTSSVCTAQKLVDSAADKDSAYTTVNEAAREEANDRNVHTQRTLGVKGGVIEKALKELGRDIVGEITHNEDGTRKSIDDIALAKLFKHITDMAQRQTYVEIRKLFKKFAGLEFDFRKTIAVNMSKIQVIRERLELAGIKTDVSQVALIMLANVENASQKEFGTQFIPVLQQISQDYSHDKVHDNSSLLAMKKKLAAVDAIRNLAAAPSDGSLAAAADDISILTAEFAADVDSFDDSAAKSKTQTKSSTTSTRRGRSKSRAKSVSGTCPYCRKFGRKPKHADDKNDTCWFNPKYKGWRPSFAVGMINKKAGKDIIKYKGREYFTPDLGGYPTYKGEEQCSFVDEWASYSSE